MYGILNSQLVLSNYNKISPKKKKIILTTQANLIGNKVADKITKTSKTSLQNNEEKNVEHDREIPKESYMCSEKRQQIINDLKLIW